ncbi:MAG TPA: S8 family serine peptidase [Solirubrobacteraceae bacterium]|nr:S8 family serine peptidase [Solirubrobacteraceae bacterium]
MPAHRDIKTSAFRLRARAKLRLLLRSLPAVLVIAGALGASAVAAPRAHAHTRRSARSVAEQTPAERPASSAAAAYVPEEVVAEMTSPRSDRRPAGARTARAAALGSGRVRIIHLRRGESVPAAVARLRSEGRVRWAAPNYIARTTALVGGPPTARASGLAPAAGASVAVRSAATSSTVSARQEQPTPSPVIPINEGAAHRPGGWELSQWNFAGSFGVDAPQAWANVIADHAPGGRGVTVAVLDTGIAYRNWRRFRRSPGFSPRQFVPGYDFVDPKMPPIDRNGHGTFVAGEIAEETGVRFGLTGLAYGVKLMPVRVLNSSGEGNAATIARGIRFAVDHHAQVINMSLEFPGAIVASDVPELISALRYARRHHVLVVAAAGNDDSPAIPFPARAAGVVSVGATTEHGCLADYSDYGRRLTLVAPGGGPDASIPQDPNCHPEGPPGRDIFQVTLVGSSGHRFGIPDGYEGTSMAAPEVSATAALVIASGVLGHHPTPDQVITRLKVTARPLGSAKDRSYYGAGLLDAAAATAAGGPGALSAMRKR